MLLLGEYSMDVDDIIVLLSCQTFASGFPTCVCVSALSAPSLCATRSPLGAPGVWFVDFMQTKLLTRSGSLLWLVNSLLFYTDF